MEMSEFMDDFLKEKDEEKPVEAASPPEDETGLRGEVISVLRSVYDPEIPVDIYELGLIYDLEVENEKDVRVLMTLTTPMCPVAGSLPGEVESRLRDIAGIGDVTVDLTWDPPWDPNRMSDAAKLELGML